MTTQRQTHRVLQRNINTSAGKKNTTSETNYVSRWAYIEIILAASVQYDLICRTLQKRVNTLKITARDKSVASLFSATGDCFCLGGADVQQHLWTSMPGFQSRETFTSSPPPPPSNEERDNSRLIRLLGASVLSLDEETTGFKLSEILDFLSVCALFNIH